MYFIPYILLSSRFISIPAKFRAISSYADSGARNYLPYVHYLGWGAVATRNVVLVPDLGLSYSMPGPIWGCSKLAFFYLSSLTVSGFSPILAYVFSLLDGKKIIEGSVTLFLAVIAFFLLPDFPESNTFLTPDQTAFVLERIECDRGDSVPDQLTLHKGLDTVGAYGKAYVHVLYPASVSSILLFPHLNSAILTPRFKICLGIFYIDYSQGHGVELRRRAASRFIVIQGVDQHHWSMPHRVFAAEWCQIFRNIPIECGELWVPSQAFLAYICKLRAHYSVSAGVGGIIASTVYREKEFPENISPGLWVTLGAQFLLLFLVWATTLHFTRLNNSRERASLPDRSRARLASFKHSLSADGPFLYNVVSISAYDISLNLGRLGLGAEQPSLQKWTWGSNKNVGQKLELESASAAIAIIQSHAVEPWSPVDRCTSVAANEGSVGVLPPGLALRGIENRARQCDRSDSRAGRPHEKQLPVGSWAQQEHAEDEFAGEISEA
ncbi:hypothetical protein B0H14DRAFT_2599495 [Mycena olivaceomarginata]|nr:hypothetical protein B0H14DRAFT_2599495 [Mycena olivaceomarginata]